MQATQVRTMLPRADIEIETPRRRTILMVECKPMPDASNEAAARLRGRLVCDDCLEVPPDSFFMIASALSFHLWKPGAPNPGPPDYTADAKPVLRTTLGKYADEEWPGGECMRIAVSGWLFDLAWSIAKPDESEANRMLLDSGLYDLIKEGRVRREVPG